MPKRRSLRQGSAFKGIEYFTIEKGSAAESFFHAGKMRDLAQAVNFEFPIGCTNKYGNPSRFCLSAIVEVSRDESITVEVGMTFIDVNNHRKTASLQLYVSLMKNDEGAVLDLTFEASGCAVVFQLGQAFSLSINVCITGSASGESLLQPNLRTFSGSVDITISFNVNVPVLGSIVNWSISAFVSVSAMPYNDITAYGSIGTDVSLWLAGAGVSIDVTGNTLDNMANKWEFVSGVNFNAWVKIFWWSKSWNHRWEIWQAGPVVF